MTPARCIAPPHEEGDCWRACIAAVLNLPAAEVPNFCEETKGHPKASELYRRTRAWLAERGLGFFRTYCSAEWEFEKLLEYFSLPNTGVPIIITGQSIRDLTDNHAVVAMDGKVVCDPSDSGIAGSPVDEHGAHHYWWLYVIAFADASRLAR